MRSESCTPCRTDRRSNVWRRAAVVAAAVVISLAISPGQALALACGDTVRADTVLDSDLGPCDGIGLRIGADGISVDLNGHRIFGVGDRFGILVEGRKGVRIKNGVISNFSTGVWLERTDDSRIGEEATRLRVENNSFGIRLLEGSSRNEIVNTTVLLNAIVGISIGETGGRPSDFNQVRRNEVVRNGLSVDHGIGIRIGPRVSRGLVASNTVSDNASTGIVVHRATVVVGENTIERNGGAGISLEAAEHTNIAANRVRDNRSHGIHLRTFSRSGVRDELSSNNQLSGNEVAGNRGHGVFLERAEHNRLFGNIVSGNGGAGFQLTSAMHNVVLRNESQRNQIGVVLVGVPQPNKETRRFDSTNGWNTIDSNLVQENRFRGITLEVSMLNRVSNNRVFRHQAEGIVLLGNNDGNLVEANEMRLNLSGIVVEGTPLRTRLISNRAEESLSAGISVRTGAEETRLEANTANRNAFHGIEVLNPRSTLTRNTANDNGVGGLRALGIFAVPGVVDGGGNTAAGNTDPRQCVGVVCT